MTATADIQFYCDNCGRGCCNDNQVLCNRCIDEKDAKIRELENELAELQEKYEELEDEFRVAMERSEP